MTVTAAASSRRPLAPWTCAALWLLALPAAAAVQSDGASRHSQASLAASVEVPVAAVSALAHGSAAVVSGVGAAAGSVAITVSLAGAGVSFVIYVSADLVRRVGLAAGTALSVTAVASGWLISAGGEALCFIANDAARPHFHSHRYGA